MARDEFGVLHDDVSGLNLERWTPPFLLKIYNVVPRFWEPGSGRHSPECVHFAGDMIWLIKKKKEIPTEHGSFKILYIQCVLRTPGVLICKHVTHGFRAYTRQILKFHKPIVPMAYLEGHWTMPPLATFFLHHRKQLENMVPPLVWALVASKNLPLWNSKYATEWFQLQISIKTGRGYQICI